MTTPKPSELRPCPFCDETCEISNTEMFVCVNNECPLADVFIDWKNSYCWKQLEAKDKLIETLVGALSEIKEVDCFSCCGDTAGIALAAVKKEV